MGNDFSQYEYLLVRSGLGKRWFIVMGDWSAAWGMFMFRMVYTDVLVRWGISKSLPSENCSGQLLDTKRVSPDLILLPAPLYIYWPRCSKKISFVVICISRYLIILYIFIFLFFRIFHLFMFIFIFYFFLSYSFLVFFFSILLVIFKFLFITPMIKGDCTLDCSVRDVRLY